MKHILNGRDDLCSKIIVTGCPVETSVNVVLAHVKEKELWQLETCPNRGDYSECTAKSMYMYT